LVGSSRKGVEANCDNIASQRWGKIFDFLHGVFGVCSNRGDDYHTSFGGGERGEIDPVVGQEDP
jgi:hypothetical protein